VYGWAALWLSNSDDGDEVVVAVEAVVRPELDAAAVVVDGDDAEAASCSADAGCAEMIAECLAKMTNGFLGWTAEALEASPASSRARCSGRRRHREMTQRESQRRKIAARHQLSMHCAWV
jgi:hypothetical protein